VRDVANSKKNSPRLTRTKPKMILYVGNGTAATCYEMVSVIVATVVDPCGGSRPVILRTPSGSLYSPGYDDQSYPNDAYCRWLIQAPPGFVSLFSSAV